MSSAGGMEPTMSLAGTAPGEVVQEQVFTLALVSHQAWLLECFSPSTRLRHGSMR